MRALIALPINWGGGLIIVSVLLGDSSEQAMINWWHLFPWDKHFPSPLKPLHAFFLDGQECWSRKLLALQVCSSNGSQEMILYEVERSKQARKEERESRRKTLWVMVPVKMNIVEKIASRSSKLNVYTQQKEWNEYENKLAWHRITVFGERKAQFNLKSYWVRRKCHFNSIRGQFIMCILWVRHNVTAGPGAFALFPDNGSSRKGTLIYFRAGSGDFYVYRGLSQIGLNPFQSRLLLPRRASRQHRLSAGSSRKTLEGKTVDFADGPLSSFSASWNAHSRTHPNKREGVTTTDRSSLGKSGHCCHILLLHGTWQWGKWMSCSCCAMAVDLDHNGKLAGWNSQSLHWRLHWKEAKWSTKWSYSY